MKLVKKKKSTHLHSSIYVIQSGFRCIHVLNESFKLSFIRLQADIVIWNYRNILEEIRMEYCTITAMTTFRRSFQGCCCSKISFINTGGTLFVKKKVLPNTRKDRILFCISFSLESYYESRWQVLFKHIDIHGSKKVFKIHSSIIGRVLFSVKWGAKVRPPFYYRHGWQSIDIYQRHCWFCLSFRRCRS